MSDQTQRYSVAWLDALRIYLRPNVASLALLGFSSGLPYLLVFSTLTAWLRDSAVDLSTIGFFAWVGLFYSLKFVWAPWVDRFRVPLLSRALGHRRSWMALSQIAVGASLILLSQTEPNDTRWIAALACLTAFFSATQDIVIDAYRIESAEQSNQAAMSAMYILGYRAALLVSGAGALLIADVGSWSLAYLSCGLLMSIGLLTTCLVKEPPRNETESNQRLTAPERDATTQHVRFGEMATRLFVAPITSFFQVYGRVAWAILALVALYRLSDIVMGVMANPFYLDKGYTKSEIAGIAKGLGFGMSIFGAFLGGVLVMRFSVLKTMLLGALLVALTNLLFAFLAQIAPSLTLLALVISLDNLSGGVAATSFVAYLSGLTQREFTATQYALFSSLMTLPGKFISGFSGMAVSALGYFQFFVGSALLGIPAILLTIWAIRHANGLGSIETASTKRDPLGP
ncbi:MAG: AmpG family muropeptide MFS transporter [Pseudomonadales bacterium]